MYRYFKIEALKAMVNKNLSLFLNLIWYALLVFGYFGPLPSIGRLEFLQPLKEIGTSFFSFFTGNEVDYPFEVLGALGVACIYYLIFTFIMIEIRNYLKRYF